MRALEEFEVTLTFCFTPEHRGVAPHHGPPLVAEEFAEFCAGHDPPLRRGLGRAASGPPARVA